MGRRFEPVWAHSIDFHFRNWASEKSLICNLKTPNLSVPALTFYSEVQLEIHLGRLPLTIRGSGRIPADLFL